MPPLDMPWRRPACDRRSRPRADRPGASPTKATSFGRWPAQGALEAARVPGQEQAGRARPVRIDGHEPGLVGLLAQTAEADHAAGIHRHAMEGQDHRRRGFEVELRRDVDQVGTFPAIDLQGPGVVARAERRTSGQDNQCSKWEGDSRPSRPSCSRGRSFSMFGIVASFSQSAKPCGGGGG